MAWMLSVAIIIAGTSLLRNPHALVERKNVSLAKQGLPPIAEGKIPHQLKQAKSLGVLMLLCGGVILLCDLVVELFRS